MSYDIYGNPLRRGHCEVHPHVHEEYPCSVCMSERGWQNEPHNHLEQLQHDFEMQGDYIRQLEKDRNELKAQVEQLRSGLNQAIELLVTALIEPEQITDTEISELRDIEQATPAQCLAEIKAQAVEGYSYKLQNSGRSVTIRSVKDSLIKYANQLRQQGEQK